MAAAKKADEADPLPTIELADSTILTEEEIAEIRAEAEKQFLADRKASVRKAAIKGELDRLHRLHGGSVIDGPMGELVTITVDLPENSQAIIWNQRRIENGKPFTAPRHVIAGILDIMWRGQVAQHNLDGKTRDEFYRRQRPVVVTPKAAGFVPENQTVRIG